MSQQTQSNPTQIQGHIQGQPAQGASQQGQMQQSGQQAGSAPAATPVVSLRDWASI